MVLFSNVSVKSFFQEISELSELFNFLEAGTMVAVFSRSEVMNLVLRVVSNEVGAVLLQRGERRCKGFKLQFIGTVRLAKAQQYQLSEACFFTIAEMN